MGKHNGHSDQLIHMNIARTEQAAAMAAHFGDGVIVDWAMRYGNPSIPDRLAALKAAGCNRILIAPLYPQYSGEIGRASCRERVSSPV